MDAAAAASLHWGLTFMASAPRLSKNRPILRTNTSKNADEGGGGWSKIPKILRTSYKVEASLHSGEDNGERGKDIYEQGAEASTK